MLHRLWRVGMLLIFMLTWGCAQNRIPEMPNFTTQEQKICGQKCLSIHTRCSAACAEMFDDAKTVKQREKCQNNCNIVLEDCYDTCR